MTFAKWFQIFFSNVLSFPYVPGTGDTEINKACIALKLRKPGEDIGAMVNRIMTPTIPIPWSPEPVTITLHDKSDFVDVVKVKDLEKGKISWVIQMDAV